jgi:hypothetical protein
MLFFLRTLAYGNKELICLKQMDKGGEVTYGQERQTSVVLCPAVSGHDDFSAAGRVFFPFPFPPRYSAGGKKEGCPGERPRIAALIGRGTELVIRLIVK